MKLFEIFCLHFFINKSDSIHGKNVQTPDPNFGYQKRLIRFTLLKKQIARF